MNKEDKILELLVDLTTDMRDVKTRLGNVERDVATLKSDVATLKSDVATLKSDVATLKDNVAENTLMINAMRTNLEMLDAKMDGLTVNTPSRKQVDAIRDGLMESAEIMMKKLA